MGPRHAPVFLFPAGSRGGVLLPRAARDVGGTPSWRDRLDDTTAVEEGRK